MVFIKTKVTYRFAKCGFGVILSSEILVDPEGKIFGKGHFIDDSNEYKFIHMF